MKKIILKIRRQKTPKSKPYWETFEVPHKPGYNIVSLLQEIRRNPVNKKGEKVEPPIWECNCMEEVCGACSMRVNGKPCQSCAALVDKLKQPIVLEPLSKFPIVRDLMVDRESMFKSLKEVKAWIEIDGTYDLGPGPGISPQIRATMYRLSQCMTCGCCLEACPQINERSPFMGAAPLAQITLFNEHPTGKFAMKERINAAMSNAGIANCGNAQNCERVCPKEIPLVSALAKLQRQVVVKGIFGALDD